MTFEEIKEIFKKSIDTTDTMNHAIENFIQSIYLKGYDDALKHAHCTNRGDTQESEDDIVSLKDALNEIKEEVKNCIVHSPYFNTTQACCKVRDDVMQIFDKHIRKIEEVE